MPPVLASPEPDETLLLYVMATTQVISATLVVEREEPGHIYKLQRSVYYIGKVLYDCETHYNQVQKLLNVILITKRKLLHYFENHPIHVITHMGSGKSSGTASPRGGSPSGLSSSWGLT
jgi:hypothetical protein